MKSIRFLREIPGSRPPALIVPWAAFFYFQKTAMLSESAVAQFKKIYEKQFGREITPTEAREKASQFLRFMGLILAPLKEEEFQELRERTARKSI